jgi:hypothetical protein
VDCPFSTTIIEKEEGASERAREREGGLPALEQHFVPQLTCLLLAPLTHRKS